MWTVWIRDQTAHSVQSDLDLHCPHTGNLLVSSTVSKELMHVVSFQVWNFQNGHNLHKLEAVAEAEVTGIMPLTDKKVILSVGWSRQITVYDDSDPDVCTAKLVLVATYIANNL